MRHVCVFAGMMSAMLPSPAFAQSVGLASSSDARVSVRVVIPPLGAAVRAMRLNAKGGWTITAPGRGLMLRVPDRLSPGENGSFDLYAGTDVLLETSFDKGSPLVATGSHRSDFSGLNQIRVDFRWQGQHAGPENATNIIIRSL